MTRPDQSGVAADPPRVPPAEFNILLALGGGTMHGYAIMQAFEELTDGADHILPGTLYATVARMLDSGLIEEAEPEDPQSDGRRRYYRATALGKAAGGAEAERLRRLLGAAFRQGLTPAKG